MKHKLRLKPQIPSVRSLVLVVIVWALHHAFLTESHASEGVLGDAELVAALRAGGLNIYFRHAATDWSQHDHVSRYGDWLSCDGNRIRQLSNTGRAHAKAIGSAMRRLRVPVARIISSPYCRCLETAKALGLGPVQSATDVMNLRVAQYFGGRDAIVSRAQWLLSTPPAPATNTVIVAHGNVAREATPVYPGEAEAVVFQPLGNRQFRVLGRIPQQRWTQLLQYAASQ